MFQILECSKKKNLKIEHHHQPYKDVLDKCGIQIFIGSHTSFFITILKEGPHYPRIECTTYVTLALGSLSQCPCVIRIDRGGNSSKRSHCGAKISLRSKMSRIFKFKSAASWEVDRPWLRSGVFSPQWDCKSCAGHIYQNMNNSHFCSSNYLFFRFIYEVSRFPSFYVKFDIVDVHNFGL